MKGKPLLHSYDAPVVDGALQFYGFNRRIPLDQSEVPIKTDESVLKFILLSIFGPNKQKFKMMKTTMKSIQYNLDIRSKDIEFTADETLIDRAIVLMTQWFPNVKFPYVDSRNVEVTTQGASGVGYECCHTKEGAFTHHYSSITQYVANPWKYRRPIFKAMGKEEVLKLEKVLNDQGRMIQYPPVHFYFLQSCYTQSFDDFIKKACSWVFYGHTPFGGGFNKLVTKLKRLSILFKGDVSKFDSCVQKRMFNLIYTIRRSFSEPEDRLFLSFIEAVLARFELLLQDGSIQYSKGQPSGSRTTSSDNCLGHLIIIFYMILYRLRELKKSLTLANVLEFAEFSIFSDDHVGSTDDEVFASFAWRKLRYAELGFTLKEEDDLVSRSVSDLTFLGGRFTMRHGMWCYNYDDHDKFREVLEIESVAMSPSDISSSLYARCILTWANPVEFNKWINVFKDFCENIADKSTLMCRGVLPNYTYFRDLHLGFEQEPLESRPSWDQGMTDSCELAMRECLKLQNAVPTVLKSHGSSEKYNLFATTYGRPRNTQQCF